MATFRPFAYNTGSTVSATTQVGDLAIGTNELPLSEGYGGLSWKNGPDEDLGYVIGYPQSGGTQPLPISGTGFVQFWRSKIPGDDTSFINLAEYLSGKYSTPQVFANPTDAKIWLNSNGFWTSYDSLPTPTATEVSASPTPTPTLTRTPTPTVTPSNTPYPPNTYFFFITDGAAPTAPNTNGQLEFTTNSGSEVTYNPNITDEVLIYLTDKSGLYHPEFLDVVTYGGVLTMTQGSNTVILSGNTIDTGLWASYGSYISGNYLTVVQPSANPFVSGSPINLVLTVNYPTTPTPTNTETPTNTPSVTPTLTPTNPTLLQILNQTTGLRTVTSCTLDGVSQTLTSGSFPITAGNNGYALTHGPSVNPNEIQFNFGGSGSFDLYSYKNGVLVNYLSNYNSSLYVAGGITLTTSDQLVLIITDPGVYVTPTPTATNLPPTPTPTNTGTPTNTPTPSTSPQPVTGYSFNLVATPYNFPSSGNSIMNNTGGLNTGSTEINVLATGGRGFYFNSFDTDGIDRTSYYSTFTGQSVTITFSQTGNTAIYSGDTNSFKQWIQAPTGSGFVFGANIGVPPSGSPSGAAVLIQSATTNYTIGFPVYVSLVVN